MIDGFDELKSLEIKTKILNEINFLATSLTNSRFILTSRTGDFYYNLDSSVKYEIARLNDHQIKIYINNWFEDEKLRLDFYKKLNNSPYYDTATRPLNLANLCAIYEREKDIPERPRSIYKKILDSLIFEWDCQNFTTRASKYAHFQPDQKFDFLANLAYELKNKTNSPIFSKQDLEIVYKNIHKKFRLPENQIKEVIQEIETHNGIFIQSGYENFEFSHYSLQEYLISEHLIRLPEIPQNIRNNSNFANEIALTVALSTNSNEYLAKLLFEYLDENIFSEEFLARFIDRINLENPDFYPAPLLAISLFYLFSIYYKKHKVPFNNNIIISYRKLLNSDVVKESINLLNKIYIIPKAKDTFIEIINMGVPYKHSTIKNIPVSITIMRELIENIIKN